jgi:hypothetical protein
VSIEQARQLRVARTAAVEEAATMDRDDALT